MRNGERQKKGEKRRGRQGRVDMCQTTSAKGGRTRRGSRGCVRGESFPNNICNESNICNGRKGGEVRREEGKISN